jgi:hypothetical protein
VLERIYVTKWDEIIGGCTKFHNEELRNLYFSPNISRMNKSKNEWAGHVARTGEKPV